MHFEHGSILFNKTATQCRAIGRRGGRARARNRRLHQVLAPATQAIGPPEETAHEASLLLDERFPWLAGCERQCSRRA